MFGQKLSGVTHDDGFRGEEKSVGSRQPEKVKDKYAQIIQALVDKKISHFPCYIIYFPHQVQGLHCQQFLFLKSIWASKRTINMKEWFFFLDKDIQCHVLIKCYFSAEVVAYFSKQTDCKDGYVCRKHYHLMCCVFLLKGVTEMIYWSV